MNSGATAAKLDALISTGGSAESRLDEILAGGKEPSDSSKGKGKARLNAENQSLQEANDILAAQNKRMAVFVKVAAGLCGLLGIVIGCLLLRQSGLEAKMLRKAFEVLNYREARTLQANAIVLSEYTQGLERIRDQVNSLPNITEDERQVRLQAMARTIAQANSLRDGFLKLVQDNEKERGKGISFEYKDPFLKRPINFEQELGGEISLDKLRDEVRANARMDEAMKDLGSAMLDPMPIADQIRAEAKRQNAPVVNLDTESSPATQPLQLPGVNQALGKPSDPLTVPPQQP